MESPTVKQLELLMALNPFKGKITYQGAAKELGISVSAVQKRMVNLKKGCPKIYEKFMAIKKDFNKRPIFYSYEIRNGIIILLKERLFEDDY